MLVVFFGVQRLGVTSFDAKEVEQARSYEFHAATGSENGG